MFNIFLTTLFSIHFITRGIYIRFAIKLILGHIRRNDEYRRIYLCNYKSCLHFDATFAFRSPLQSYTCICIYTRVFIANSVISSRSFERATSPVRRRQNLRLNFFSTCTVCRVLRSNCAKSSYFDVCATKRKKKKKKKGLLPSALLLLLGSSLFLFFFFSRPRPLSVIIQTILHHRFSFHPEFHPVVSLSNVSLLSSFLGSP